MAISAYVLAAMCGNFSAESYINPGVWESFIVKTWDYQYDFNNPNQGGYGLGQWTNVGSPHDRLWNLYQYMTANGYSMTDGNGQLNFLIYENRWNSGNSTMGFSSLSDFLGSTSTDINGLTAEFMHCWEINYDSSLVTRQSRARDFFDYFALHSADNPDSYRWLFGNRALDYSTEQMNNAMCVYFKMNGHNPSPGPDPGPITRRKGMPIWMYIV